MSRFSSITSNGAEVLLSVGTTALLATTSSSVKREVLYLENRGPEPVFYGPSNDPKAVLEVGQFCFSGIGEGIDIFLKTLSGTSSVVVQEYE